MGSSDHSPQPRGVTLHPDECPTIGQHRIITGDTFPGLRAHDREQWLLLPISQTRDSDALERSNFRVVLKDLGGESETLEVHRFGHWACGWYEIAIIAPERSGEANAWKRALNNYPVADDTDFSELEWEDGEGAEV